MMTPPENLTTEQTDFSLVLGGPLSHIMAAKAVAFAEARPDAFRDYAQKVADNPQAPAEALLPRGAPLATGGTQRFLAEKGINAEKINKVQEVRPHIEDAIRNRQVQLVINTTDSNKAISHSISLLRSTLMQMLPYFLMIPGA